MAEEVIKRDGSREPFDPEKIRESIRVAAEQAGLSEDRINELVDEVGSAAIEMTKEREVIATREIREKILSDLDEVAPKVSAAWREYEEEKA